MSKNKEFIATFTFNQGLGYVSVMAETYTEAHEKMVKHYGSEWGFLYKNKKDAGVEEYNLQKRAHIS